jgi:hypothetical protein
VLSQRWPLLLLPLPLLEVQQNYSTMNEIFLLRLGQHHFLCDFRAANSPPQHLLSLALAPAVQQNRLVV